MKGTNFAQFWDVEFTGTLPITKSTTVNDQQFLTTYLNSSVHQNSDGSDNDTVVNVFGLL